MDQGKFEDRIVKMGSLGSDMEWDAARPQARELGERILELQRGRREPEGLPSPEHALCRLEAQSLENVLEKQSGTGTKVSDKYVPTRGEIWPAKVADISLPGVGSKPVDIMKVSPEVSAIFEDFKESMLEPEGP